MLKYFRGKKGFQLFGLLGPGALWMLLFFNLPILIVLFISFVERGRAGGIKLPPQYTLENYFQFFNACTTQFSGPQCDSFLYLGIFGGSVRIGLVVTLWCIVLGYPLAYFIAKHTLRRYCVNRLEYYLPRRSLFHLVFTQSMRRAHNLMR